MTVYKEVFSQVYYCMNNYTANLIKANNQSNIFDTKLFILCHYYASSYYLCALSFISDEKDIKVIIQPYRAYNFMLVM